MNTNLNLSYLSHKADYHLTPTDQKQTIAIVREGNRIQKFTDLPIDLQIHDRIIKLCTPYFSKTITDYENITLHGGGESRAICIRDQHHDPIATLIQFSECDPLGIEQLITELNQSGSPAFYFTTQN